MALVSGKLGMLVKVEIERLRLGKHSIHLLVEPGILGRNSQTRENNEQNRSDHAGNDRRIDSARQGRGRVTALAQEERPAGNLAASNKFLFPYVLRAHRQEQLLISADVFTRAAFWLLYWSASFCTWLLFVNTAKSHELWMAAATSVIAATAAEIVREQPFAAFRPRLFWLIQCWREPWYIVEGCAAIFWVFFKHLFHPEPSILREIVFDSGGSDPASAARRALAIIHTTVPPNFVVLGIDLDKNVMVVHQVSETATPAMTRNLGARS